MEDVSDKDDRERSGSEFEEDLDGQKQIAHAPPQMKEAAE